MEMRDAIERALMSGDAALLDQIPTPPQVPAERTSRAKKEAAIKPLQTFSAFDVYNSEHPEPEAIIDGLLYAGLSIFAARPKIGKSWFALQTAIAVATDTPLCGRLRVRKPGRVLYIALEETQRRTAPRLRKLTGISDCLEDIDFVYEVDPLMSGGAAQIDAHLRARPCTLVIIDTFFAIVKQAGRKNVDLLQTDYNQINTLREICEKHNCAMILIHHSRKADGDDVDVVLGTSGITAACDSIWSLKRSPDRDCILRIRGRDMEERIYGMRFDKGRPFGWTIVGKGEEATLTEERREIVDLLREGPMEPKDIAEALEKKPATVRRLLQKLAQDGVLIKTGKTYVVASDEETM